MNREQFLALFGKAAQGGADMYKSSMEQQALDARSKANNEAELARLIKSRDLEKQAKLEEMETKNKYDQDSFARNEKKLNEFISRFGNTAKFSVTDNGITYDPEAALAANDKVKQKEKEYLDNKVIGLSDRIQRTNISDVSGMLKEINQNWAGGESVTKAMNLLPSAGIQSYVASTFKGEDAAKEFQTLQKLANTVLKAESGTAVSKYEEGRQLVARGMSAGGSPELVKNGLQMMRDGLREAHSNIRGGYSKEVRDAYSQNRGEDFENIIPTFKWENSSKLAGESTGAPTGSTTASESNAEMEEYLKLKAKYRR